MDGSVCFKMSRRREIIIASAAYVVIRSVLEQKKKRDKRWWITQFYKSRQIYSGSTLLRDLKFQECSGQFQNFVRMSSTDFEEIINMIGPKISKMDTKFRTAVSVKERLAITLRFLATGDSYTSMQYLFKVSKQLISSIIPETCKAICDSLKEYYRYFQLETYLEEQRKRQKTFERNLLYILQTMVA